MDVFSATDEVQQAGEDLSSPLEFALPSLYYPNSWVVGTRLIECRPRVRSILSPHPVIHRFVRIEDEMAKKRKTPAKPISATVSVTPERFVRLYRMIKLLAAGPQTRDVLSRRLRLDVRGFYRDLDLLRSSGVTVTLASGHYTLEQDAEDAMALLPFPDPRLTLGEARALAKGRGPSHRRLADTIARVVPTR